MVTAIIILSIIGLISATLLYIISRKFHVEEDSRIDEIESILPGANCGGCGYAGCRNFAEQCTKATSLDSLLCPVGGNEVMQKIAPILGLNAVEKAPRIAVIRCNGSCENRPQTSHYEGAHSCAVVSSLYREQLQLRVSWRRRLCGSLRIRRYHDGSRHPTSPYRFQYLRCLWFLCKSLPQTFNRATEETRIHDICGLQQQRQRHHRPQSLFRRLHRLWKMCQDLPRKSYFSIRQFSVYRR